MTTLTTIVACLSVLGLGGGVGSVWYMRSTLRSINADATSKEVSADMLLSKFQTEMYDRLWKELSDLRDRYSRLERYALLCNAALRKQGIEPPSWPDIDMKP